MKIKPMWLIFYGLMGASISLISNSIIKWGKISSWKEGILISLSIACIALQQIIWIRYLPKDEVFDNTKATGLYRKYPGLIRWLSLTLGIVAGVTVLLLLSRND